MNKNYDWNETNTTVTITFPLLYKIDKKKFDYTITDSYIKLNLYQMKQFHFIDLMDEIDIDSSQIILEENKIIFNLIKKENKLWKKLESNLTKEELKERRKKANERFEENLKKKKEFEKFVVDKSIKIDDNFREELRNKKQEEKTLAEKDLYKFVDKMDNNKIDEEDEDDNNINKDDVNTFSTNINKNIEEQKYIEEKKEEEKEEIDNKNDNIEENENDNNKYKLEKDPYEKSKETEEKVNPIKHSIESRRKQIFYDEKKEKIKKEKGDKEQPLKIESPMVAKDRISNGSKYQFSKYIKSLIRQKRKRL